MTQEILYNLQLINQDFFTAFGLFTILYLLLSLSFKKQILHQIDEQSTKFISFVGIVYLILWIVCLIIELNVFNEEDKAQLLHLMFGQYWFGFWTQPLLWFIITQLLRFRRISKNILLRLLFSLLLMVSIERIVIIYTSFHRDYLPSSWAMSSELGIYPSSFVLTLLIKILLFLMFVGIFYFLNSKIKRIRMSKA
ncbi:MAG: hypothetical protein ABI426_08090 [Flavobacterium sp.]